MPFDLESLASNKLLLQYLSAAGQDIGAGKPLGANINAVTQQNIAAQNYAKLLKNMLAGGGKLTLDKDNINIKAPVGALQGGGQTGSTSSVPGAEMPNERSLVGGGPSTTNVPQSSDSVLSSLLSGNIDSINPSASPLDVPGADLAGLTPQDIGSALGLKLKSEELDQQRIIDVMKRINETRKLDIEESRAGETADIKNYQYAVRQGYSGSFEEFKNSTDTAGIKEYEFAKKQGYTGTLEQWKTDLAKAARININIGEKVEQAEALADVKARKYFTDPEGLTKDVTKYIKDAEGTLFASGLPGEPARKKAEAQLAYDYIKGKIASNGKVTNEKLEGRTFVFTVQWNDGKVSEVRYANP